MANKIGIVLRYYNITLCGALSMVATKTHDKLIKPVLYYEPGKFRLFGFFFLPMRPRVFENCMFIAK